MAATPKQHIDGIAISEHWFVAFFIRVLLVQVFLTATLLWAGFELV